MTRRQTPTTLLALTALLCITLSCGGDDGSSASLAVTSTPSQRPATPSPSATLTPAVPTSSIGQPANTVEEALGLARDRFTAAPPFVVHDIESVVHVDTTVGQARDLFDPEHERKAWDAPDHLPAWGVVAYGSFQVKSVPGSSTPGPSLTSVWVVIPKGDVGLHWWVDDQSYELSRLGTVVEVPVPLPPFPTLVTLESQ